MLLPSIHLLKVTLFHSAKKRRDDGTPGGRYAKGHCPVIVYVRRTHDGTLPVALFKRRDRWDTFNSV